jgi:protein YIPF6
MRRAAQIFTLLLASLLSLESSSKEVEFCVVFVVVIAGGLLLTANVLLLGGRVSFFQSVSLLGYCMFPLDVAAIIAVLVRLSSVLRLVDLAAALLRACL